MASTADPEVEEPRSGVTKPKPFGVYVHVPFCSVRCGYCDFNTYTATELGGGASQAAYADQVIAELDLAVPRVGEREVETVFFGGGTPTQLPSEDLVKILRAIDDRFGLAPGAEVTTEANPDSVTPASLATLRDGGFTRISFGMQSAVPHVLEVLDRTHDPARVPDVVAWARAAGFEQVSLDLIYGTPGESASDWQTSLEAALACEPDHVSAYSLIVEEGTALGRRVRRGELPMPEEDDLADKYGQADTALRAAGLAWYEVSNWARDDDARCRHNLGYWRSDDWWGAGPGAHSHLAGERWWNVKHPRAYAERLAAGELPIQDSETLDADALLMERVMLELRLREGLALDALPDPSRLEAPVERGLVTVTAARVVLTDAGRLLADGVVRDLLS
ncbi:MAG: radical SAM family heme chaperone HemW [Marmoricola sp.]